jgi:hypothetical protein
MAMSQKVWYRTAFVSISALSGSEVVLQSRTTSLGWSGGFGDLEGIDTFGGKLQRLKPKDDMEVTFDGIPVSHADFDWLMAGQTASTAFGASGVAITTSTDSVKYRVELLWTNQAGVTAANTAITGTNEAYRRAWADLYMTQCDGSMDAGDNLTAKIAFKCTAVDDNNVNNWGVWSKDTTSGTLSALNSYTSSTTKW